MIKINMMSGRLSYPSMVRVPARFGDGYDIFTMPSKLVGLLANTRVYSIKAQVYTNVRGLQNMKINIRD